MAEETNTYVLVLSTRAPWVGCQSVDKVPLSEYNYSDQQWDALTDGQQEDLIEEWSEDNFWNIGYEHYGEVDRG